MIQAMRRCHKPLSRNLLVFWCVLLFACAFTHVQAAASGGMDEASASLSPLHSNLGQTQHDQDAADTCSALQNAPLSQQLLTLLALTALAGLAGLASYGLLTDLQRRISRLQVIPLFSPGLSTPIRKQLHRYNE